MYYGLTIKFPKVKENKFVNYGWVNIKIWTDRWIEIQLMNTPQIIIGLEMTSYRSHNHRSINLFLGFLELSIGTFTSRDPDAK